MSLSIILYELLERCHKSPGTTKTVRLGNGLHIYLRISADRETLAMSLARVAVEPAVTEWNTCMKNLPAHMQDAIEPRVTAGTDGDQRIFRSAQWRPASTNPAPQVNHG